LLINNAGSGFYGSYHQHPADHQQSLLRLNVEALVKLSHAFLQQAQRGDALLNVSSALSLMAMPGSALYSGTKAFVTSFSESLWYEYKPQGIFVTAVLPGPIDTPFHSLAGGSTQAMRKSMVQTPEAVVKLALKLLKRRTRPSRVSGLPFQMITRVGQMLPRSFRLHLMASNGPVDL
jgi:hypothetical protein